MPKSELMKMWEKDDPEMQGHNEKRKREAIEVLRKMQGVVPEEYTRQFEGGKPQFDAYSKDVRDRYDITDQDINPAPYKASDVIESTPEELAQYDEEQRKRASSPGFGGFSRINNSLGKK